MRWLVADTVYQGFLDSVYRTNDNERIIDGADSYDRHLQLLMDQHFGSSDFYSQHLRANGHEVTDIILNAQQLQLSWGRSGSQKRRVPPSMGEMIEIFKSQVAASRPDTLYLLDMNWVPDSVLRDIAPMVGRIVGQVACPLNFKRDFSPYGLVLSSFPHFVERFRSLGVPAELVPLAFEPSMLAGRQDLKRTIDVSFVGSLDFKEHSTGNLVLRAVAEYTNIAVWGPRARYRKVPSWLKPHYRGEAWGNEMFTIFGESKIVLNRHTDIAHDFVNNMRLFEATGMGSCLVTDTGRNLPELFDPGREVATYSDPTNCAAVVESLLRNDSERRRIAHAGQQRTLTKHTYAQRTALLEALVDALPRIKGRSLVPPRPINYGFTRRALTWFNGSQITASTNHQRIDRPGNQHPLLRGWKSEMIPSRQRLVADQQLQLARSGKSPAVFAIAAEAVRATSLPHPTILEVGCASAYYAEVFALLLDEPVRYVGVDYSMPLLREARRTYPQVNVLAGDAANLPFGNGSFDIVLSAAVLMHLPDWESALGEAFRVARKAVILHRTPVGSNTQPLFMRKSAYGVPVVELVLPEQLLMSHCKRLGGRLVADWKVEEMRIGADNGGTVPVRTHVFMLPDGLTQ